MAIISFSPDTIIEYVPAYGGNRDSDEPCIVKMRFVSYAKVMAYSKLIDAKSKGTTDSEKRMEISREIQKQQFVENVESVSGFLLDGKTIITASEFYDNAPFALIIEIIRAMEDSAKLSEGQRKNS